MELIKSGNKIILWIKKYKYAAMVILIGLVLMMLPRYTNKADSHAAPVQAESYLPSAEERLCGILSKIDGAGEVSVMLMESHGEETVYQTDSEQGSKGEDISERHTTVTVTDSTRNESGLIKYRIPPQYCGAIIVCQGADDPSVRLAIMDAVSKLTGLGTNHISVLKMN